MKCFPRDQTNPLAYSCSFTFHISYKNGMTGHGGRCQNAQAIYYKNLLGTHFVEKGR